MIKLIFIYNFAIYYLINGLINLILFSLFSLDNCFLIINEYFKILVRKKPLIIAFWRNINEPGFDVCK